MVVDQYIVEVVAAAHAPINAAWRRHSTRRYPRPAWAVLEAVNAWIRTPENRPTVRIRRVGAMHPIRVWTGGPFQRLTDGTWRRIPQRRLTPCFHRSSKP